MSDLKLVGLCGSLRSASTNRTLMRFAATRFGAPLIEGDLRLPLYDGDLEDAHGIPAEVEALAARIRDADAVILGCPEYNGGVTGVMKNALDWLSRVKTPVWRDKPVAILSAAAGRAGGARAQYALRLNLVAFRPALVPGPEVLVGASYEAFDADGAPREAAAVALVDEVMAQLRTAAQQRRAKRAAA
ncbi:NADPH-dependent FMN reductase [Rhodobaculum claviforme]|uniref:NADPH-dependent FMN reductase n=1 Tax=Rhodobaculum claviforme TaxID=1549854 RepID=A0A934WIH5_9RHOB|nr:NAD(P)H-dependent oxidoreductase [Rhodobaculum claviforme]MBK5926762.1 NADPH-dependent FMN reductase [Rhodobaculum claviforme]